MYMEPGHAARGAGAGAAAGAAACRSAVAEGAALPAGVVGADAGWDGLGVPGAKDEASGARASVSCSKSIVLGLFNAISVADGAAELKPSCLLAGTMA